MSWRQESECPNCVHQTVCRFREAEQPLDDIAGCGYFHGLCYSCKYYAFDEQFCDGMCTKYGGEDRYYLNTCSNYKEDDDALVRWRKVKLTRF